MAPSDPASSDDPIGGDKVDDATVEVHQPDESDRARAEESAPSSSGDAPKT